MFRIMKVAGTVYNERSTMWLKMFANFRIIIWKLKKKLNKSQDCGLNI